MNHRHSRHWLAASLLAAVAIPLAAAPAVAAPTTASATTPASATPLDTLDRPALTSALAARSLVNGLAAAGPAAVVAVGQRGHVLRSTDAGASWQQAGVPVSSDLVAVTFVDDRHGWAVGHDGVILASADGGQTWQRQLDGRQLAGVLAPLQQQPGVSDALKADARRLGEQGPELPWLDVWFENRLSGYVVGAYGLLLRTRDGGSTWQPLLHEVDNPKALHLHAVRGIGNSVWIVGEQGLLLRRAPGDTGWRRVNLPYAGSLFGIVGSADGRRLLVHGLRGNALHSHDGGNTWRAVDTGLQVGLTAATIAPDGRWLLASQAGHVLVSTDEGERFQRIATTRQLPAAALIGTREGRLVIGGPRGLGGSTLP